jgi:hypothetical protein
MTPVRARHIACLARDVEGKLSGMSKEDLAKFLAAVKQVGAANTASPEAARNFLEKEGYLNKDGSIAAPYKSAQSSKDD